MAPSTDRALAAQQAHAHLVERCRQLASSDEWLAMLRAARAFHRYSPANQLLLWSQGASGMVNSYHRWHDVPDVNGEPCQVAKGAKALRVYAPIVVHDRRSEDPEARRMLFKLVPVFDETQLNVAPAELEPTVLTGDGSDRLDARLHELVVEHRFIWLESDVELPAGAKGLCDFIGRRLIIRSGMPGLQTSKTRCHEVAHMLAHQPADEARPKDRRIIEIEAESVAHLACDAYGLDTAAYSDVYVGLWADGDAELIASTATRVLACTRLICTSLEATTDQEEAA